MAVLLCYFGFQCKTGTEFHGLQGRPRVPGLYAQHLRQDRLMVLCLTSACDCDCDSTYNGDSFELR
jgi:hypothetical protein